MAYKYIEVKVPKDVIDLFAPLEEEMKKGPLDEEGKSGSMFCEIIFTENKINAVWIPIPYSERLKAYIRKLIKEIMEEKNV